MVHFEYILVLFWYISSIFLVHFEDFSGKIFLYFFRKVKILKYVSPRIPQLVTTHMVYLERKHVPLKHETVYKSVQNVLEK